MNSADFLERLGNIRERIDTASQRARRSPAEITLVAVTKKQPTGFIEIAHSAGLLNFAENYVQEAADKCVAVPLHSCCWHLIGHLQSNKAKAAVELFDLIQSVDSIRLARQIAKQAEAAGKLQHILLQVHLGEEATKTGFPPDMIGEVVKEIVDMPGIYLQGLMGIAPQFEDSRHHFRLLRRLFETLPAKAQTVLSMGMTGDFEIAIEEGATMVRIGTALFGSRMDAETTETLA